MERARTSYDVVVARHVSPATLATFPVPLVPTAVPRNTVYRLRVEVGADGDIADIVRRLTDRGVALLEIRRCPQPSWSRREPPDGAPPAAIPSAAMPHDPPPHVPASRADDDDRDVVVVLRAVRPAPFEAGPPPDDGALAEPVLLRPARDDGPRRSRRPRHRGARD